MEKTTVSTIVIAVVVLAALSIQVAAAAQRHAKRHHIRFRNSNNDQLRDPTAQGRLHRNALQELLGFVPTSAAGAIEKGDLDEHAAVALAEARSMPDLFHWITARAQPDAGQELRIARSVR